MELRIAMLKSNLCNYSELYILVRGWITIAGHREAGRAAEQIVGAAQDSKNKQIIFVNYTPFTDISKIYWLFKWNKQYKKG